MPKCHPLLEVDILLATRFVSWEIAVTSAPMSSLNLTFLLFNSTADIHDEFCFVVSASKYAESTAL